MVYKAFETQGVTSHDHNYTSFFFHNYWKLKASSWQPDNYWTHTYLCCNVLMSFVILVASPWICLETCQSCHNIEYHQSYKRKPHTYTRTHTHTITMRSAATIKKEHNLLWYLLREIDSFSTAHLSLGGARSLFGLMPSESFQFILVSSDFIVNQIYQLMSDLLSVVIDTISVCAIFFLCWIPFLHFLFRLFCAVNAF